MFSQIQIEEEQQQFDWSQALCKQMARADSAVIGLFFSEKIDEIKRAKAICAECDLAEACLSMAMQRREPFGVWGGELFLNGQIVAKKRGRGRPRKDSSADDEYEISA